MKVAGVMIGEQPDEFSPCPHQTTVEAAAICQKNESSRKELGAFGMPTGPISGATAWEGVT
jgi:hypothetical protein